MIRQMLFISTLKTKNMAKKKYLFLDFDGVICDSINETILCSWLAYYQYLKKELPNSVPCDHKRQFMNFRPFIRSAADYIVIQDMIACRKQVKNQAEFDALLRLLGNEVLAYYQTVFYQARTEIFTAYKTLWLKLNPIYPHMYEIMKKAAYHNVVYLISTKKTEFILEILRGHYLDFDVKNIIYSGKEEKLAVIARILKVQKRAKAYFIDDQISHLYPNHHRRIKTYLASWGYIEQKWLKQGRVKVLTPAKMLRLVSQVLS
jgi:hypothetical protein